MTAASTTCDSGGGLSCDDFYYRTYVMDYTNTTKTSQEDAVDDVIVTLQETNQLIANGTTGLCTWQVCDVMTAT